MRHDAKPLVLACLFLLALPAAIKAQKIDSGQWTGTVTAPSGETIDVTFDVTSTDDATKITVNAGANGSFEFQEVKVLKDRLTFSFSPGPTVNCTLMLGEDRSYKGDCVDPNGEKGVMRMVPPKKGWN